MPKIILPLYWIVVIGEDEWEVIRKKNVYGVPETSRTRSPRKLIKPGDIIIFYVKVKGSRYLGGKFVGAFKVVSNWYRESKPLWPSEVREGKVEYPWRIKLKPIKLGIADFKELISKLVFVEKKEKAHIYFAGTLANFGRPIPERDARIIIENLK